MLLIEDLNAGMTSHVRVDEAEAFETTSGVLRGCVLAPALFLCCHWLYPLRNPHIRIPLWDHSKFMDLHYANDTALFSDFPSS